MATVETKQTIDQTLIDVRDAAFAEAGGHGDVVGLISLALESDNCPYPPIGLTHRVM